MTDISTKTSVLLTLSLLKGVGPAALRHVAQIPFFEDEDIAELIGGLPRNAGAKIDAAAITAAANEADRQIGLADAAGARIISTADQDYPLLLKKTKDDPQILFVKGNLASEPERSVAVIGTREPTVHGTIIAKRLTRFFVEEGWSVVSGLALGCDALAHEAAMNAAGHTVAVLAHGLQTIAPSRHKNLAARILETGGALVTEYTFGQEPLPTNFVKRDRIQAGFARGVVMIQSDIQGGSLHASRASVGYGRWLAVPFPTEQDISRGEPKIQANLKLADGTPDEKATLLKCDTSDLNRLIVLRGKSDYALLLGTHLLLDQTKPEPNSEPAPIGDLFSALPAPQQADAVRTKPPDAGRTSQTLLDHMATMEKQLEVYHHRLVEHGRDIAQQEHFQQLLRDFDRLEESLRRVSEIETRVAQESKLNRP